MLCFQRPNILFLRRRRDAEKTEGKSKPEDTEGAEIHGAVAFDIRKRRRLFQSEARRPQILVMTDMCESI